MAAPPKDPAHPTTLKMVNETKLANELVDRVAQIVTVDIGESWFKKTNIERFFIPNQEENLYLTKREAECVAYMIDGATAKQTAKVLGISFRTVEHYFKQAKEKLQCATKDELINFLIDANIHDVILSNTYAEK